MSINIDWIIGWNCVIDIGVNMLWMSYSLIDIMYSMKFWGDLLFDYLKVYSLFIDWLCLYTSSLQVKYKYYDLNDYLLCKFTREHLHTDIKGYCDRLDKYLQITWQIQMIKRNHMIHMLCVGQQNQMVIISHESREQYLSCQATTKSMNNTLALSIWMNCTCIVI